MSLLPIPLVHGDVALEAEWLDPAAADRLLDELRDTLPWENHRVRLFGREHASPRLSCWLGDPGAVYRYSGNVFEPRAWTPALLQLRERLQAELGVEFNSVLANRYRNGRDCMGWHSDDERELGDAPMIASVSLGATRRFVLGHRQGQERFAFDLPHRSVLVMAGATQRCYRHALPRTARPVGERINLTFRRILA